MQPNRTPFSIAKSSLLAAFALFLNGFGVYLTIHAGIGAGPWDVFHIGLSKTFGILYGTASIITSLTILVIDIAMREPVGIAMFIDAFVVGKSVDFFDAIAVVPVPRNFFESVLMMLVGLAVMGYTQYLYMHAALGCGPRDTLLVGISRRVKRIPIGVVSIALLGTATLAGYLLGGPVGVGTIICAVCAGPIMQLAFHTVRFDATEVKHQRLMDSAKVLHIVPKRKKA